MSILFYLLLGFLISALGSCLYVQIEKKSYKLECYLISFVFTEKLRTFGIIWERHGLCEYLNYSVQWKPGEINLFSAISSSNFFQDWAESAQRSNVGNWACCVFDVNCNYSVRYEQRKLSSSSIEKHVSYPLKLVIHVGNICRFKVRSLRHSGQCILGETSSVA